MREVLVYPDELLKQKSKPVIKVDDSIRELVKEMLDTLKAGNGTSLAAPQIGVHRRILVVGAPGPKQKPLVLINPEIVTASGRTTWMETCLSIPGESEEIERFKTVTVRGLNEAGANVEVAAEGPLAMTLQHEMDHLDGVLYADRLSGLKRGVIRTRMLKYKSAQAASRPLP